MARKNNEPPKIENPANVDPVTRQEIQKKSLSELKVEIKFHLGQMAGHAVEIGKLLIEAKEQVGHGGWANWLEENFNLKQSSAQNFMNIAKRFGANSQTFGNLGYSQMLNLLALPAGEEENFIAEKAARNKPPNAQICPVLRFSARQGVLPYPKNFNAYLSVF